MLPLLGAIPFLPPANAWALIWRNSTGDSHTEHSNEAQPCKEIDQSQGKQFNWDAQGGDWCLYFYRDENCTQGKGHSCNGLDWNQDASVNLKGFVIEPGWSSSAALASSTRAATATSSSAVSATSTSSTSPEPSSSGSSLSGGEIAGVVVGSVAGGVLLCLLGFFLGRRKRRGGDTTEEKTNESQGPGNATEQQQVNSPSDVSEVAASRAPEIVVDSPDHEPKSPVELVGNSRTIEMSDTHRLVELGDGDNQKPPYYS